MLLQASFTQRTKSAKERSRSSTYFETLVQNRLFRNQHSANEPQGISTVSASSYCVSISLVGSCKESFSFRHHPIIHKRKHFRSSWMCSDSTFQCHWLSKLGRLPVCRVGEHWRAWKIFRGQCFVALYLQWERREFWEMIVRCERRKLGQRNWAGECGHAKKVLFSLLPCINV